MRATFRNLYNALNLAAFFRDRHDHALSVLRWTLVLVPMAALVGTLCAAFLWSLDAATQARFDYPWLLYLLPLGGAAVALLYHLPAVRSKRAIISSSRRYTSPEAAFRCAWHRWSSSARSPLISSAVRASRSASAWGRGRSR